jgi:uncharacterized protein YecT (DUF1311 family)
MSCVLLTAFEAKSDLRLAEHENESPSECIDLAKVKVPSEDLPSSEDRVRLKGCDASALYFGFDRPPSPVAARKCAYLQREAGETEPALVFGGSGLLAMIYANGKGARRSFELALKFACEIDGAPAENEGRMRHLLELREKRWSGSDFSLCDSATSGFLDGNCAALQERFDEVERKRRLDKLAAGWPPETKRAFGELREAARRFFEASAQNEVDLSGTSRGAFVVREGADLNLQFVEAVARLEQGHLPNFETMDLQRADTELNQVYGRILASTPHRGTWGTITPEGIRTAQRTWLPYREAWVRFGSIRYPGVTPTSWRTWLTRERLEMLKAWRP